MWLVAFGWCDSVKRNNQLENGDGEKIKEE